LPWSSFKPEFLVFGPTGIRAAINLLAYRAAVLPRQLKDVIAAIKSIYTARAGIQR
jgi:hypothetical protein